MCRGWSAELCVASECCKCFLQQLGLNSASSFTLAVTRLSHSASSVPSCFPKAKGSPSAADELHCPCSVLLKSKLVFPSKQVDLGLVQQWDRILYLRGSAWIILMTCTLTTWPVSWLVKKTKEWRGQSKMISSEWTFKIRAREPA